MKVLLWHNCCQPSSPRELIIEPLGTKTIKGRGKAAIPLQLAPLALAPFSFIHRLPQFLKLCAVAGHPVTKYIFRPQCRGGGSFQETATSSSEYAGLLLLPTSLGTSISVVCYLLDLAMSLNPAMIQSSHVAQVASTSASRKL